MRNATPRALILSVLNVLSMIAVLAVNALASFGFINNKTTQDIANNIDALFFPAGYVFSIWGIIYVMQTIWVIRGVSTKINSPVYNNVSLYFIGYAILNILWLYTWHYEQLLWSTILLFLIVGVLIKGYLDLLDSRPEKFDKNMFSLTLAWTSVASVANTAFYLKDISWNGFGIPEEYWTYFIFAVTVGLAVKFSRDQYNWVFPAVFVWALVGIAVRHLTAVEPLPMIAYAALLSAGIIIVLSFVLRKKRGLFS